MINKEQRSHFLIDTNNFLAQYSGGNCDKLESSSVGLQYCGGGGQLMASVDKCHVNGVDEKRSHPWGGGDRIASAASRL